MVHSEYLLLETNTQVSTVFQAYVYKVRSVVAFNGTAGGWAAVFRHLPTLKAVMNGTLNGRFVEINVNLFALSLNFTTGHWDCNHSEVFIYSLIICLSLYTFYDFIFITDVFFCLFLIVVLVINPMVQ